MGTHPHGINRLRSSNRSRMKTFYQVANDTLLVVIGMGIYALITKIL
jgi:NH3-dependent NAD+ synthetase